MIYSVALTPDGRWALTGSHDNTARLWSLKDSGTSPRVLLGHNNPVCSVALTPDGRWALTGSSDATARLWEIIPRMSLAEAQEIILAHEETTRNNAQQGRYKSFGSKDQCRGGESERSAAKEQELDVRSEGWTGCITC